MTSPSPATVSRPRSRPSARYRGAGFTKLALLLALAGWTAWVALQRPTLHAAEAAFAQGDDVNALRLALDDLRVYRWSRASALIAARSLSRKIYPDEAEPLYAAAGRFGALPLEAQQDRIQGLIRGVKTERAVALCHEVLATHPDDLTTLRFLTWLEWTRGNLPEACDAADRLANAAQAGKILLERLKVKGPDDRERLSNMVQGLVDGLDLLAKIHHDAERFDAEAASVEAILRVDPELKFYRPGPELFWLRLGNALIVANRPAEARDYLQARITPYCDPVLLDFLGAAQRDAGDRDGAERSWRESARRAPNSLNPWLRLGTLDLDRKRYANAAESLEKAVAIAPDMIEANHLLASAYRHLGRLDDAKTVQAKVDELRKGARPKPGGMEPSR